jgi:hypothetical protein
MKGNDLALETAKLTLMDEITISNNISCFGSVSIYMTNSNLIMKHVNYYKGGGLKCELGEIIVTDSHIINNHFAKTFDLLHFDLTLSDSELKSDVTDQSITHLSAEAKLIHIVNSKVSDGSVRVFGENSGMNVKSSKFINSPVLSMSNTTVNNCEFNSTFSSSGNLVFEVYSGNTEFHNVFFNTSVSLTETPTILIRSTGKASFNLTHFYFPTFERGASYIESNGSADLSTAHFSAISLNPSCYHIFKIEIELHCISAN